MNWQGIIQDRLRALGYKVTRYPVAHYFDRYGITVILDVGANRGQYAHEVRRLGYKKKIISFEPHASAYTQLQREAMKDDAWITVQIALGAENKSSVLQMAKNTVSSSMLDMLPIHKEVAPDSVYIAQEHVQVQRLDDIFDEYCTPTDNIFLKIDTQGYEMNVLKGAEKILPHVAGMQLEMALAPLYKDSPLVEDIIAFARSHDFVPVWLDQTLKNAETQQLLQVDGIFLRKDLIQ